MSKVSVMARLDEKVHSELRIMCWNHSPRLTLQELLPSLILRWMREQREKEGKK